MKKLSRKLTIMILCFLISAILFPNNALALSVPTIPTNLTASTAGTNQINLSWDAASGATSYCLYRSTSYSGSYSYIAAPTSTSYADTGLAMGTTYFYEVEAVNRVGSSEYSSITCATTDNSNNVTAVPPNPVNLTATAAGSGQINLSWYAASGATSYSLYRSTSYSGSYSYIAGPTSASYVDTGLAAGTTYYYEVRAVNSAGSSGYSGIANAATTNSNIVVPAIPTNLTATAAGSGQINLSWDAASGAASYYLYRSTSSSGTYSNIAAPTSTSYVDTGLAAGTTYYYEVQAVNSAGSSGYSGIANAATTNSNIVVPAIPTNLTATAAGSGQINLSWDAASGAASYYLYRSTSSSGTYSNIAAPTSTSYVDTGLAAGTTYYYEVQAVNSAGSSGYSGIANAATNSNIVVPAIPTNLTATAAGSGQINLSWDAASGATSYYLYRSTSSSGTYSNIAAPTSTSYVDTGLAAGTTYYYEVQAVNSAGSSGYSGIANAATNSNSVTTPPDSSATIQSIRLAGQNRYETAVEITKSGWNTTSYYVVIANGDDFAGALCGAPLAAKYNAPILLSSKDSLDEQTQTLLSSLKTKKVFIIGGVGVISTNVEQAIKSLGIDVSRISGNDRYDTSIKIAQAMGNFNQAVIATGEDFPDALSIAPIASMKGIPIILTPKDNLPTASKNYLNKTVKSTYVVGGVGAVSDSVFNQLPDPTRLSGQDRYETNLSIINKFSSELDFGNCFIATGQNFPDALAGSVLAGLKNSPIVLVSSPVEQSTIDFINSKSGGIKKIIVFGGAGVVPDSIIDSIDSTADGSSAPSSPTDVTATIVSSSQIDLTWSPVSGATSYIIYGATSYSGNYTNIATVTTPSYSNTGLWAGTTYYYKVQAVNSVGSSAYSAVTSATTALS